MTKYAVGDHLQSKCNQAICTIIKIRSSGSKPYTIQWQDGRKVHCDELWLDSMIFLEDDQICNNLTSAQESAQDSPLQDCNLALNSLESQKQTITVQTSSSCVFLVSTTTAMCEPCQLEKLENNGQLISSQPRHPASHLVSRESGEVKQMSVIVSPPSNERSNQLDPNFSVSRTSQDCLTAQFDQGEQHCIYSTSYARLPDSAMMRNGLVLAQDILEAPLLEKGYCWLESPGALSTGNGRPPGQSRLEAQLRNHGLLEKQEVLRPDFLLNAYNLPPSYLDPLELKAATELLDDNVRQQEIFSIQESPPLRSNELITSIHLSKIERTQESESLILCPSCQLQHIYLSGGCGVCGLEPQTKQTKPKKQPKGCLYPYIERKKLKDGSVIEYPRVVNGERDPDNPSHWRWGFNWEEKINDKWKGRSIGSISPDLILDIKLMQIDGASLEEIIKFIKLSKSKK